jgi:predicted metal-dependent peptidase
MSCPSQEASQHLRAALKVAVERYPYHASLLTFDRFVEDQRVTTMAVITQAGRVCYPYNRDFVRTRDLEHLVGVLHHEVNHVIFGHVFADRKQYPDERARTVAAEVTVNEWVCEPLPGNPLTLADFPDLPPGEDTEARYKRLAGRSDLPNTCCIVGLHEGELDPLEQRRVLRARLARELGLSVPEIPLHWMGEPETTELERVDEPTQQIDWPSLFRRSMGRTIRQRPTFSERPRRLPHLAGVVPADTIQPAKPRVMAVIDTSGSMDPPALARVAAELKRVARLADVHVVECDKTIRAKYRFRHEILRVAGRGGTDLRPPFRLPILREMRPRLVVYFTDGAGHAPARPPRVPVIWCLTPEGTPPTGWGHVVRMSA